MHFNADYFAIWIRPISRITPVLVEQRFWRPPNYSILLRRVSSPTMPIFATATLTYDRCCRDSSFGLTACQKTNNCLQEHLLYTIGEGHRHRVNQVYHISIFEKDFYYIRNLNHKRTRQKPKEYLANELPNTGPSTIVFYVVFPDKIQPSVCKLRNNR